jgi:hypothetical protein
MLASGEKASIPAIAASKIPPSMARKAAKYILCIQRYSSYDSDNARDIKLISFPQGNCTEPVRARPPPCLSIEEVAVTQIDVHISFVKGLASAAETPGDQYCFVHPSHSQFHSWP